MISHIKLITKLDKTDKYKPIPIVKDTMKQSQSTLYVYKVSFQLPLKSCTYGIKLLSRE